MANPFLAGAAGAGQGLEQILTDALAQAASKRQDATLAETVRSHGAEEDYRNRALAETSAERKSRDAELVRVHGDQQDARTSSEAQRISNDVPGGTIIPATDKAATTMQAGGASPLLRAVGPRPSIPVGPLQPEDSGDAVDVPSFIKLSSSAQKKQASADDLANRTADRADLHQTEAERHDKAMENKPPAPDRVLIQTEGGYMPRAAATATLEGGGVVPGPDSSQTKNRKDMGSKILPHIDDVQSELDAAEKAGALGPLKGRTVNEFLAGKVGSTGDAATDELLGNLNMDLSMVSSGVASLHGRGGANAAIGKGILDKINASHMSHAELTGALQSLKKWAQGYAGGTPDSGGKADYIFKDGKLVKNDQP